MQKNLYKIFISDSKRNDLLCMIISQKYIQIYYISRTSNIDEKISYEL